MCVREARGRSKQIGTNTMAESTAIPAKKLKEVLHYLALQPRSELSNSAAFVITVSTSRSFTKGSNTSYILRTYVPRLYDASGQEHYQKVPTLRTTYVPARLYDTHFTALKCLLRDEYVSITAEECCGRVRRQFLPQ